MYPALNRPDTKFDDNGIYKADVRFPIAEAEPLIKKFMAIWKEHVGKAPKRSDNPMFYDETGEDGNATGFVVFKLRVKNKLRKDGKLWDRQPLMIDAKKNDFDPSIAIWGGTKYRVQVEIYEWVNSGKKGVSLQPLIVQILDLKTGDGSGDRSAFDEEDGYEASSGGDKSNFEDEDGSGVGDDYSDDGDY